MTRPKIALIASETPKAGSSADTLQPQTIGTAGVTGPPGNFAGED